MILIDHDALKYPLDEMRDTQVLRTWFGGRNLGSQLAVLMHL